MKRYVEIAVGDSASFALTYSYQDEVFELKRGTACNVPVLGKLRVGIVLREVSEPSFACKAVHSLVPQTPAFPNTVMQLAEWTAHYYLCPIGRSIRLLAPGFFWKSQLQEKRSKRFAKVKDVFTGALPSHLRGESTDEAASERQLTESQEGAVTAILTKNNVTLLHGVTGSGKTEVYIEAARRTLASGRTAMILVPEIALTPQMTTRFRSHFGAQLAVLHSGLTGVEVEREWYRVATGQSPILLGVRSAVYAPLQNVGLMIVDEEHETSYKCEEMPCYNARDVAVKRASIEGAKCVLGSATPSLESFVNAQTGKYAYHTLPGKFSGNETVYQIVDSREALAARLSEHQKSRLRVPGRSSWIPFQNEILSPQIVDAIKNTAARGEQIMVILNRRGHSQFALCKNCGDALQCPNCAVTTTIHKRGLEEVCHYCGFKRATLQQCPKCHGNAFLLMGAGTQHLEKELQDALPSLKVDRLDRDVMTSHSRLSELIRAFREKEIHCLVGTQMLSKGHDFPHVSLVVVLHVEDGLFLPDFRASERTFQLLVQASGRSGRGKTQGNVMIQSLIPKNRVLHHATTGHILEFLAEEIETRRTSWLPPFSRQLLLEVTGTQEAKSWSVAEELRQILTDHWAEGMIPADDVRLAGPYPAALAKVRGQYRFHLCITSQKHIAPARLFQMEWLSDKSWSRMVRVDVDPYQFI